MSILLSGLRWHLSGLLELPLEQRLLVLLAGGPFHPFLEETFLDLFVFCGSFFFVRTQYVRACCRGSDIYCGTASTAQPNTAQRNQPCKKQQQIKYAPIRARQRKQADRVGASQHAVEHLTARCVLKREEIKICPGYKSMQPLTKQLSWCCCAKDLPLFPTSLSIVSISYMQAWTLELLSFTSTQFAPKIMDLSDRFILSFACCSSLPCERAWRAAEASRRAKRFVRM